jgi:hypothetical protein
MYLVHKLQKSPFPIMQISQRVSNHKDDATVDRLLDGVAIKWCIYTTA